MSQSHIGRIFVSYSHRGNGPQWKTALLRATHLFEQYHLIDVWQDGKIRVSSFWDDDIQQAMESAQVAVVLLTPEALDPRSPADPNYILDTEFPHLRERQRSGQLTVFPIVCEDCNWREHDWLRATQASNNSNPLSGLSATAQDQIFRQVGTEIARELSRKALSVTLPVGPTTQTYLDRFPLTRCPGLREERLIGREAELALLDLALSQPHTAIVSLVAWGGVGKSMLVQKWLHRLERANWLGIQRVYAWSFYSQGTTEDRQASEDMFLAHALKWFGVQCEPTLSPWDKGRLLADAVARERTLLILDGIEPLQYPPGPMGGQLRAPGVQSLLKQLARKSSFLNSQSSFLNKSLCLVTTREPLTDLADFQRRQNAPWGSVLRVDLGNLNEEAGAALLHHAGANRVGTAEIKPDDRELFDASREVDGHALTLNLLGRFLDRAHSGDIRRRDLVKFEEADRAVKGETTFKMLAAFAEWFSNEGEIEARALTILRLLGLFDRPADAGCMSALRMAPVISGLTDSLFVSRRDPASGSATHQPLSDKSWNDTLHFLFDFGLIAIQPANDDTSAELDCHPLIREYFARMIRTTNQECWRSAHRRLFDYLSTSVDDTPDTFDRLQPLYFAVSHGCEAGLYETTRESILDDRIRRGAKMYGVKMFGAFSTHLASLSSFFHRPWSKLADGISPYSQSWLLNETGFCLGAVGRIAEAIEPLKTGIAVALSSGEVGAAQTYISNLSEVNLILGRVDEAVELAKRAIEVGTEELRDAAANGVLLGTSRVHYQRYRRDLAMLAWTLLHSGAVPEALKHFCDAEQAQAKLQPQFPQLYSTIGYYFIEWLLAEVECAAWKAHLRLPKKVLPPNLLEDVHAEALRRVGNTDILLANGPHNPLDNGLNQLATGRAVLYGHAVSLKTCRPSNFEASLVNARGDLRKGGVAQHIPRGLLSCAWLSVVQGNSAAAQSDLDEAWDIAERGPMRLHMADIHLYRARLFFREKSYPWKSPQDDLAAAEKLINDCGYHRRDEELADAKRAILGS